MEIIFPVENENLKKKVMHILKVELADNTKANVLQEDGTYRKDRQARKNACEFAGDRCCPEAVAEVPKAPKEYMERVFIPAEPVD